MNLMRNAGRFGLVVLLVIVAFLLLQLGRKADAAYANRLRATASSDAAANVIPSAAAAWRQDLFFDGATAPPATLVRGWSAPEPGSGVWSNDRHAVLKLPPAPFPGAADVALTVEAFVAPSLPAQRVRVRVGARTLGEWRLTEGAPSTLHLQAPPELHAPDGSLTLQLDLPDAASPAKHVAGAMDVRLLAIKLRRVDVTG
jgi:hypothetical protein